MKGIMSKSCLLYCGGHADLDLKGEKFPCVTHGTDLSKYSHVINMGLF